MRVEVKDTDRPSLKGDRSQNRVCHRVIAAKEKRLLPRSQNQPDRVLDARAIGRMLAQAQVASIDKSAPGRKVDPEFGREVAGAAPERASNRRRSSSRASEVRGVDVRGKADDRDGGPGRRELGRTPDPPGFSRQS